MTCAPQILSVCNLVWETTVLLDRLPPAEALRERDFDEWARAGVAVVRDGGGSAANTAVAARGLGMRVAVAGLAGDDEAGRLAIEALERAGVETHVRLVPGRRTKQSLILKEARTDRGLFRLALQPRAVAPVMPGDVPEEVLAHATVLHLDRVSATGLTLARRRSLAGKAVSLDLHTCPHRPLARERLDTLLPLLSLVQVSEAAARGIAAMRGIAGEPREVAECLSSEAGWVVVTLGGRGAVACERGSSPFEIPPSLPPRVVDSTGAGDAFAAALLEGFVRGRGLRDACARAAEAGARACGWLGAREEP